MGAEQQDISERPTLTLIEEDDAEPMVLTKGDWRGLWHRFDQMHRAQQGLGEQMGTVRSSVHEVREDMSKVLVATAALTTSLAATNRLDLATPVAEERRPLLLNSTLGTLVACAVLLTGRQMGWW